MPIEMGLSVPSPTPAPTPAAAAEEAPAAEPPEPASAGFIEHQKVKVVSFVSRWWLP